MAPYVRTDWTALDATLKQAYADGVAAMKQLSQTDPNDPRGWTYQANIHGLSTPVPPGLEKFWAKCQHQTYFFLSWHRMYIWYFERIVRWASRNDGFALPYWNYTDTPKVPATRALPQEFRQPATASNPLYVPDNADPDTHGRDPDINAGGAVPESDCRYDIPYTFTDFYSTAVSPGPRSLALAFGGRPTPEQQFGRYNGQVEQQPHNDIHVVVGGEFGNQEVGLMGDPDTAAQDPIFWLHHGNIDRLWEGWLALGGGRKNPQAGSTAADEWLGHVFYFHDETGAEVQLTGAQVVDTAAQLDYVYDKLPPKPLTRRRTVRFARAEGADAGVAAALPADSGAAASTTAAPAEVGTGQETGIRLGGTRTVSLSLHPTATPRLRGPAPAGAAAMAATAAEPDRGAPGQRLVVSLEGVGADALPGHTYEVYLNLPDPSRAHHESIYYVGNVAVFTHAHGGASGGHDHAAHAGHAAHADGGHAGHGHGDADGHAGHGGQSDFAFEVTDVVHDLRAQNEWDPATATLTFVATQVERPDGGSAAPRRQSGRELIVQRVSIRAV